MEIRTGIPFPSIACPRHAPSRRGRADRGGMNTHAYLFHGLKLVISGEAGILTALQHRLGQFPAAKPGTPSHLRFEFRKVPDPSHYAIQQPAGPNRRGL